MTSFERAMTPAATDRPWLRDACAVGLLVALTAILLAAWGTDEERHFQDVISQMYGFRMLMALGFALALRRGAVDLSIWAAAALGGVAVAAAGGGGLPPGECLLAGAACGLAVGAVNALLTVRLKVPSILATGATGGAICLVLILTCPPDGLAAPRGAFGGLMGLIPDGTPDLPMPWTDAPPFVLTFMLAGGAYAMVCIAVAATSAGRRDAEYRRSKFSEPLSLAVAMCAAGALAGLAGGIWVVEHGMAPIPTRPIGDLRLVAAAVLSGAALLSGRGRTMLVTLAVPPGMIAATIWQSEAMHLPVWGIRIQTVLLIAMVATAHLAAANADRSPARRWALSAAAAGASMAAPMIVACAALSLNPTVRTALQLAGIAVWLAGLCALVAAVLLRRHARRCERVRAAEAA